jgi:phosphoglycerate dehydrogenase-like enzyme
MHVVFHFDGSEALGERLKPLGITLCPESDEAAFERLLPQVEVLWHVLKPVTEAMIARAPKLRLIQKIGIGVTLLLMLACLRRIADLNTAVRTEGGWRGAWGLQENFGELGGRTVGLVGYGAVPRLLHPILEAMGARVLFWSRSRSNAPIEDLLARSDIVSLHLPLTPQTEKILDARKMKRGAILINTARGGLVDEGILSEALGNGHLAAAGLDVFAEEPARNVERLRSGLPLENRVA